MIADLVRAVLGALAAGVLPGYGWAAVAHRADGLAERLAYSAALSLALVPPVAVLFARLLGGVTLLVALASVALVAGTGALAVRLKGAAPPQGPALPRPTGISDGRALALLMAGLCAALASALGGPAPGWLLIALVAAFAVAGVLAHRGADPAADPGADPVAEPGPVLSRVVRAPSVAAVLVLTALIAYGGVVRHDWPYLRGEDQFSHAVMTEQMLAHGSYGSYLVYPPRIRHSQRGHLPADGPAAAGSVPGHRARPAAADHARGLRAGHEAVGLGLRAGGRRAFRVDPGRALRELRRQPGHRRQAVARGPHPARGGRRRVAARAQHGRHDHLDA